MQRATRLSVKKLSLFMNNVSSSHKQHSFLLSTSFLNKSTYRNFSSNLKLFNEQQQSSSPEVTSNITDINNNTSTTKENVTTTEQQTINPTPTSTIEQVNVQQEPFHENEQQSFNLDDFEDDVSGHQLEAAETMSSLFSSFTDYINPTKLLEAVIDALHYNAGLPWWLSIAITGFSLRLLLAPFNIVSMRSSAIMAKIGPAINELRKKTIDPKLSQAEREHARNQYTELAKKEGFSTKNLFLPLVQTPIFISFFICLNRMAREVESFQWGGMSWFMDLTVKDPYYILPVISSTCFVAVFLVNAFLRNTSGSGKLQTIIAFVLGGISFAMVPVMGKLPAALFMYWIPSNFFQILFHVILSRKSVKKFFKIPDIDPTKGKTSMDKLDKMLEKFLPSFGSKTKAISSSGNVKLLTQEEIAKLRKSVPQKK
ncbi:hypothetical protein ABK040_016312 [Willaertia magna]